MAKKNSGMGSRPVQVSPKSIPANMTAFNGKVDYTREELNLLLPSYYMIRDVIIGEVAVKGLVGDGINANLVGAGNGGISWNYVNIIVSRARRYLPMPNVEDQSQQNINRYKSYVTRAVFYNVTSRTLEGLTGQIFLRDPIKTVPSELEMLDKDADGSGLTLDQFANRCVRNCISYGRCGILVDYPRTMGPLTKQQVEDDGIQPTFTCYHPWDIINWRVTKKGSQTVITFLVLREILDEDGDDGFTISTFEQYRVLSIDPNTGIHKGEVYRKQDMGFIQSDNYVPLDANGKPLTEIPFIFVGAENNSVAPNKPPLFDLASLNIAHYRNSADYEESCFLVGQPTPVFTGISEDWITNVLKGSIPLGSRASVPLPVGAEAKLLQAEANTMPMEAMKQKEAQMVALGAKLVQIQRVAKTATQQIIETTSESSPLANIAKNVSAALVWAMGIAADFVSSAVDKTKIAYALNKDFDLTSMTADDQNATILQWQAGAIDFSEMRTVLRRAGTATLPDDQARENIKKDIEDGLIPDPAGAQPAGNTVKQPTDGGQPPKEPSEEGGPQPGSRRRISKP